MRDPRPDFWTQFGMVLLSIAFLAVCATALLLAAGPL
jgi:hypothetical protein